MELVNILYAILFVLAGLTVYGLVCVFATLHTIMFLGPSVMGGAIGDYNQALDHDGKKPPQVS